MRNKSDIQSRLDIEVLIAAFYDKLMVDEELAFIFTEVAKIKLEEHLHIICDFWEGILFQATKYRRNAMQAHLDLHQKQALTKVHFDRWLALFDETVDEYFEGPKAHQAKVRALSIATIMQLKIHAIEK